jgi:hypothetical protein
MKSFDYSSTSANQTFHSCEIKTQNGLFKNEFFRINSNLELNSKFKTPNVKAHNLTKKDFYVR